MYAVSRLILQQIFILYHLFSENRYDMTLYNLSLKCIIKLYVTKEIQKWHQNVLHKYSFRPHLI